MSESAILQAEFVDVRPVKSRKVMQLIFEVPIEAADHALSALGGFPRPDQSRYVAIAQLDVKKDPAAVSHTRWDDKPLSTRAGILCTKKEFQMFLIGEADEDKTIAFLKNACRVASRADLVKGSSGGEQFLRIEQSYFATTGRAADPRE